MFCLKRRALHPFALEFLVLNAFLLIISTIELEVKMRTWAASRDLKIGRDQTVFSTYCFMR
jgi:hypothetical protein